MYKLFSLAQRVLFFLLLHFSAHDVYIELVRVQHSNEQKGAEHVVKVACLYALRLCRNAGVDDGRRRRERAPPRYLREYAAALKACYIRFSYR